MPLFVSTTLPHVRSCGCPPSDMCFSNSTHPGIESWNHNFVWHPSTSLESSWTSETTVGNHWWHHLPPSPTLPVGSLLSHLVVSVCAKLKLPSCTVQSSPPLMELYSVKMELEREPKYLQFEEKQLGWVLSSVQIEAFMNIYASMIIYDHLWPSMHESFKVVEYDLTSIVQSLGRACVSRIQCRYGRSIP